MSALWILLICQTMGHAPAYRAASARVAASISAAPIFVRSATNSNNGAATITILTFDCTGGNYLIVGVAQKSSLVRTVSGVTANGVAMSLVVKTNFAGSGSPGGTVSLWKLANPATGNVIATMNAANNAGLAIGALLFSGVSETNAAGGISENYSLTARNLVSCNPNSLATDTVVDIVGWATASGIDISSGQTLRLIATNAVIGNASMLMSTTAGQAGTTVLTATASGAGAVMSQAAASLDP